MPIRLRWLFPNPTDRYRTQNPWTNRCDRRLMKTSWVVACDLVSFCVLFHVTFFSFSSSDQFLFFSLLRDLTRTVTGTWHTDSDTWWALLYTQTTIYRPRSSPSDPQWRLHLLQLALMSGEDQPCIRRTSLNVLEVRLDGKDLSLEG